MKPWARQRGDAQGFMVALLVLTGLRIGTQTFSARRKANQCNFNTE